MTSGNFSPMLQRGIALAFLPPDVGEGARSSSTSVAPRPGAGGVDPFLPPGLTPRGRASGCDVSGNPAASLTCAVAFRAPPDMLGVVRWLWHRLSTTCLGATYRLPSRPTTAAGRSRRRADDADHPWHPERCSASSPPRASWASPGRTSPATSTSRAALGPAGATRPHPERAARPAGGACRLVQELGGWREVRRPIRRPRRCSCTAAGTARRGTRRPISHHYDVSNEFYRLVLGPSMTYSCAVFDDPADTLEEAQANKYELICRKLGLEQGMRLLDVGCGWGGMVLHAATAPRRAGGGRDDLAPAGRPGREARRRGRAVEGGRDPPAGLPRHRRRALRRDQLDRHVRARRRGPPRRVLRPAARPASARGSAPQPRHQPAVGAAGPPARRAASSTATSSPTASCTRSARVVSLVQTCGVRGPARRDACASTTR